MKKKGVERIFRVARRGLSKRFSSARLENLRKKFWNNTLFIENIALGTLHILKELDDFGLAQQHMQILLKFRLFFLETIFSSAFSF